VRVQEVDIQSPAPCVRHAAVYAAVGFTVLQVHEVVVLQQGDSLVGVLHPLEAQLALVEALVDLDEVKVRVGLLQIVVFLWAHNKLVNDA